MTASEQDLYVRLGNEMRGPLQNILANAELMMDARQSIPDRLGCLGSITHNVKWLEENVEALLDLLSRREALVPQTFSLLPLLEEIGQRALHEARHKRLRFEFTCRSETVPETIVADARALRRCLTSLLATLIHETERGGILITLDWHSDHLLFSILATGLGADSLDWLAKRAGFEISRQLALGLGGELSIPSTKEGVKSGHGLSLRLTVAAATPTGTACLPPFSVAALGEKILGPNRPYSLLYGMRVLLCEDAPDSRLLMTKILAKLGVTVDTARNGIDAVHKALGTPFDLVLMDLQMPGLDGHSAIKEIHAAGKKIPVVALTSSTDNSTRQQCLQEGFASFLTKPVHLDSLFEVLKRFRATNASGQEVAAAP